MQENECKDTRFRFIVKNVAAEVAARLNGGQVDNIPTRRKPSIGNILTLLTICGAIIGAGLAGSAEIGEAKNRLIVVEKRQIEDRAELKSQIAELKSDVKQIGGDVQQVLRSLERINVRIEERDRREERRSR